MSLAQIEKNPEVSSTKNDEQQNNCIKAHGILNDEEKANIEDFLSLGNLLIQVLQKKNDMAHLHENLTGRGNIFIVF